jgi:hypothetical protein
MSFARLAELSFWIAADAVEGTSSASIRVSVGSWGRRAAGALEAVVVVEERP